MANALAEADSKTLFNDIEIAFFRQDIRRKLMILFFKCRKMDWNLNHNIMLFHILWEMIVSFIFVMEKVTIQKLFYCKIALSEDWWTWVYAYGGKFCFEMSFSLSGIVFPLLSEGTVFFSLRAGNRDAEIWNREKDGCGEGVVVMSPGFRQAVSASRARASIS